MGSMVLSIRIQRIFEGEKYASGIRVISFRKDLWGHLDDAIGCCALRINMVIDVQLPKIEQDALVAMRPYLETSKRDMVDWCGDGMGVTIVREGPNRQNQGYTTVHKHATVCYARIHKQLHSVPENERENLWSMFQKAANNFA